MTRIAWKVSSQEVSKPKDDDISLSHILFNHDSGFSCILIPTIDIRALIESVCGKPNCYIFYMYI